MHKHEANWRLLASAAMVAVVALSAGCREATSMEVVEHPPTATMTVRADTPASVTATATATKSATNSATPPIQETGTPAVPTRNHMPLPSESEAAAAAAVGALEQRLGVLPQDIVVQLVEAVEWSDSSLGCPEPGMTYAQMVTPGFRVLLEVDGQAYEIHTGAGGAVVLCEQEDSVMVVLPGPGTVEPGLEPLIALATKDLTERLSIAEGDIEILEAVAVVWPDASLGCPEPGMAYRQIPLDGALIRLQIEGKVYEYHSGGGRDPFLCEQSLKLQKDAPSQIDLLQLTPPSPTD